ncbi:DoxX family protein [Sphingobium lactosutens]|uniref:DoxX family protein n=1 Tax=Sphingobium lactosutens TaxID=522773 RepID=UPI0015B8D775
MKKTIAWSRLLNLALIAFFLLGAFMNLFGPASIAQDFAKWGYPASFRYVTGGLELVVAGLLSVRRYQMLGIFLGGTVMLSALLTLIVNGEGLHAAAPAVVLLAFYLLLKTRSPKR